MCCLAHSTLNFETAIASRMKVSEMLTIKTSRPEIDDSHRNEGIGETGGSLTIFRAKVFNMAEKLPPNPLTGLALKERTIMGNLLRMSPEQHKEAPKQATAKAEAQQRRRHREKMSSSEASREV